MIDKEIHVGVVGVGLKGTHHLRSIKSLIEENLFKSSGKIIINAIGDINEEKLQKVKEKFSVEHAYLDSFKMIEDGVIDALWITTPTRFHKEYFLAATKKGIHVYCEKPLAFSLSDIDEMINARDVNNIIAQVGLEARSLPLIPHLKKMVQKKGKKFGRLQNILFRDMQEKAYLDKPSHPSTWRKDKDMAYHGLLFEHMCHDLDGIVSIFGMPRSIYANIKYFAGYEDIEDSVSVVMDLVNGATLTMQGTWNDVDKDGRRYEIYFENAYVEIAYDSFTKQNDEGEWISESTLDYKQIVNNKDVKLDGLVVMADFLVELGLPSMQPLPLEPCRFANARFFKAIFDGTPAYPSLEDARRVQGLIEKCYESSRDGKVIQLG
ncbi:MAG: Gfo/Idh/MocA family protein [Candidatus Hodarchaeota archaeon]